MTVPTVDHPERHVSKDGAGWIYWSPEDDAWILEHSRDGRWAGCRIGSARDTTWEIQRRARSHLERSHAVLNHRSWTVPARLAGPDRQHAGGGVKVQGQWVKGPNRREVNPT